MHCELVSVDGVCSQREISYDFVLPLYLLNYLLSNHLHKLCIITRKSVFCPSVLGLIVLITFIL